ncbi:MAG TPA: M14 family metallopeptidase, partial [Usitatibacter sp.]|nr:M14 family metallopeptidase [Usitatibacter sp.]
MATIAVELKAPDIRPHRQSNTGTEFIHTFDSGRPGPHVLVNALTHGNEICGAIVVDRLLRQALRPVRGRLTLAFANVEAFFRFDPASPYATRFVDEDFNRVWTRPVLDGPGDSAELRRARQLRPFVEAADYLLDIHSMLEPSPPVMICGPLDKGIRFAFDVGIPEHIVSDTGHSNGTRMRDFGGFGDPASPKNALLVECGQHWERNAEHVAWQTT